MSKGELLKYADYFAAEARYWAVCRVVDLSAICAARAKFAAWHAARLP